MAYQLRSQGVPGHRPTGEEDEYGDNGHHGDNGDHGGHGHDGEDGHHGEDGTGRYATPPDNGDAETSSSTESKTKIRELEDQVHNMQIMLAQVLINEKVEPSVKPPVQPPAVLTTKLPPTGEIKKFNGDPPGLTGGLSIEVYLKRIESETPSNQWTEPQRILLARNNVIGSAKTRCEARNVNQYITWEEYKAEMLECFTLNLIDREQYLAEYIPQRKKGELLPAFIDRIAEDLDSLSKTGTMPEAEKISNIRRLLYHALPRQLHCDMPDVDSTLEYSRALARRAERFPYLKLTRADIWKEISETAPWTPMPATKTPSPLSPTPPASEKEKQTVAATSAATPPTPAAPNKTTQKKAKDRPAKGNNSNASNDRKCAGCGRTGHYRSDCRAQTATCYFCGVPGHLSSVCRQKQKKNFNSPSDKKSTGRNNQNSRWQTTHPSNFSPRYPMQQFAPQIQPQHLQQYQHPAAKQQSTVASLHLSQTPQMSGPYRPPWTSAFQQSTMAPSMLQSSVQPPQNLQWPQ